MNRLTGTTCPDVRLVGIADGPADRASDAYFVAVHGRGVEATVAFPQCGADQDSASFGGTLYNPYPTESIITPLFKLCRAGILMTTTLPITGRNTRWLAGKADQAGGRGFVKDQVRGQARGQCALEAVDLGSSGHHADPATHLAKLVVGRTC